MEGGIPQDGHSHLYSLSKRMKNNNNKKGGSGGRGAPPAAVTAALLLPVLQLLPLLQLVPLLLLLLLPLLMLPLILACHVSSASRLTHLLCCCSSCCCSCCFCYCCLSSPAPSVVFVLMSHLPFINCHCCCHCSCCFQCHSHCCCCCAHCLHLSAVFGLTPHPPFDVRHSPSNCCSSLVSACWLLFLCFAHTPQPLVCICI